MPAPRLLPDLTLWNRPFWTGGADGKLLIQRCSVCRRWQHPPAERCESCQGPVLAEATSGHGTIFTFTANEQQFHPDVPPPYVIAIVELDEQPDLRLPTNIVGCQPRELRCGLPVRVVFEEHGDVYVPLFTPAGHTAP